MVYSCVFLTRYTLFTVIGMINDYKLDVVQSSSSQSLNVHEVYWTDVRKNLCLASSLGLSFFDHLVVERGWYQVKMLH